MTDSHFPLDAQGIRSLNVGDKVTITYTGTVTDVSKTGTVPWVDVSDGTHGPTLGATVTLQTPTPQEVWDNIAIGHRFAVDPLSVYERTKVSDTQFIARPISGTRVTLHRFVDIMLTDFGIKPLD